MKKFNLTIPKPCHENWEQMTPAEKGRFCGSCQKTVVDFTAMSDRELAAFFKKPVGSVCGRLHKDQLSREITMPKKPMPWLRYFIHIAWPAFILMLKSCGSKDRVTNKGTTSIALTDSRSKQGEYIDITMGAVITPIESEDVPPPPPTMGKVVTDIGIDEADYIKGEVAAIHYVEPDTLMGDVSVVEPLDSVVVAQSIDEIDTAYVDMDTVTVVGTGVTKRSATMGCFTTVKVYREQMPSTETPTEPASALIAYPNPSRPGSILNLKFAEKESMPVSIQLLTSGGQRVLHKLIGKYDPSMPIAIQLPSSLTSGVYFIQVVYANGTMDKLSVMVGR